MKRIFLDKNNRRIYVNNLIFRIKKDDISGLAAQSTYYLIVAIIPFLFFAFNSILFFTSSQIPRVLELFSHLPAETLAYLEPIILEIIASRSRTILTIGLIVTLWSSSTYMWSMLHAVNKAFNARGSSSFMKKRAKAVLFTFLIVTVMILFLLLTVFGDFLVAKISQFFSFDEFLFSVWNLIKVILIPVVMILSFSLFYKFAPDFEKGTAIGFDQALIGGCFVTIGLYVITFAYSFYMNHIGIMSIIYGSLIGIVGLFIWLYVSSAIILIGAELISGIDWFYEQDILRKKRAKKYAQKKISSNDV